MPLPDKGAVLGIDVGYSEIRATTCFCVLRWTPEHASATFALVGANHSARREMLRSILGPDRSLAAVAVDGPLAAGLRTVTRYRAAEALLSKGCLQKRGKPGQTSSPVGQKLHRHATELALMCRELADVALSTHYQAILPVRIVEAFPNLFLAALLNEDTIPALDRNASDRFWEVAVSGGGPMPRLIGALLPGRAFANDLKAITHHDHRAGLVCALTALSVLHGTHVAVGDATDGDIMLPPLFHWGAGPDLTPWLRRELLIALKSRSSSSRDMKSSLGRVATASGPWLTVGASPAGWPNGGSIAGSS
jgi:hypothetical protein